MAKGGARSLFFRKAYRKLKLAPTLVSKKLTDRVNLYSSLLSTSRVNKLITIFLS